MLSLDEETPFYVYKVTDYMYIPPIFVFMNEGLLHFIWQFQRFNTLDIFTIDGQPMQVIHPGYHNTNSGPDFTQAKLKIGTTLWVGNIEIHVKSSDWFKHNHQHDAAYQNIILHVVYEADTEISNAFPTLKIKQLLSEHLINRYQELMQNQQWIPCEQYIQHLTKFDTAAGFDRLVIERLESKTQDIEERLHKNNNNWEETCYQLVARYFGQKVNAEPFDQLARSLPLNVAAKHKNNLQQIEALIFGQAGMLHNTLADSYPQQLYREFQFLQAKYQLLPLKPSVWKFARMRPAGFPTIRLAQFATLLHSSTHLLAKVIAATQVKQVTDLLNTKASDYWNNHYRFDVQAVKQTEKKLGVAAINVIIINAIIPMLFVYGRKNGQPELQDKALQWLENLPAEQNSTVKKWKTLHIKASNALDSQALLQLKNEHCINKKCLSCHIGSKVLQTN